MNETSKSGASIGMDLGSRSIKNVLLSWREGRPELLGFSITAASSTEGPPLLKKILTDFLARMSAGEGASLHVSIPHGDCLVRVVEDERMKKEKMLDALASGGYKRIPYSPKESLFSVGILEGGARSGSGKMRALIAIAKKSRVESIQASLSGLPCRLASILPGAVALYGGFKSLELKGSKEVIALLDLGLLATSINIFQGAELSFSRTIDFGGDKITDLIAGRLKLGTDEAERQKCSSSVDSAVVKQTLSDLVQHVQATFAFHEMGGGKPVGKVLLCGGGSLLNGLPGFLQGALDVPVTIWNPLATAKLSLSPAQVRDFSISYPMLAVATGLAYDVGGDMGMNLLPGPVEPAAAPRPEMQPYESAPLPAAKGEKKIEEAVPLKAETAAPAEKEVPSVPPSKAEKGGRKKLLVPALLVVVVLGAALWFLMVRPKGGESERGKGASPAAAVPIRSTPPSARPVGEPVAKAAEEPARPPAPAPPVKEEPESPKEPRFVYKSHGRRDPFLPPVSEKKETKKAKKRVLRKVDIPLSGVLWSEDNPLAIIGDGIYKVGDSLPEGEKILLIEQGKVLLLVEDQLVEVPVISPEDAPPPGQ